MSHPGGRRLFELVLQAFSPTEDEEISSFRGASPPFWSPILGWEES